MKISFSNFSKKKRDRQHERTDIVKQVNGIHVKILSDTITLSDLEAGKIAQIICDELKKGSRKGYIFAKRISEEVNREKICTADVKGGPDGKEWLIKVSNNPHEFID